MNRRVLRFQAPVDVDHVEFGPDLGTALIVGPVLWVKSREHGTVDFWAEGNVDANAGPTRRFTVIGTGRFVPDRAVYCGSSEDATNSLLMWHLWEICRHGDEPTITETANCPVCQAMA